MENLLVFMYGLDRNYGVVCSHCLRKQQASNLTMMYEAAKLRRDHPQIEGVYAIKDCEDMRDAYKDARRTDSMEDKVIFKVLLETVGYCLI